MAGLLDLMGVRKELKKRTDQIIDCSRDWGTTAKDLTAACNRVADALEKGAPIDPKDAKTIKSAARSLGKTTNKLVTALGRHQRELGKMSTILVGG